MSADSLPAQPRDEFDEQFDELLLLRERVFAALDTASVEQRALVATRVFGAL
jgi:hypothetical protein